MQLEVAAGVMVKVTHPDLDLLGDDALTIMDFARRFESVRNMLGRVDRHVVDAFDASQTAKRLGQRNTATLLANGLQLSTSEAGPSRPGGRWSGVPVHAARSAAGASLPDPWRMRWTWVESPRRTPMW